MSRPDLDPETKARIEAEEAYRAQIRERLGKPGASPEPAAPTAAPAPQEHKKVNPLLVLVLVLAGVWIALNAFQNMDSEVPALFTGAQPVGMEIQAQDTPDNYGLDLYLTLKDANGAEVGAAGNVQVEVYEEPYGKPERMLWSKTYKVSAADFSRGTRGMGAFQQNATFAHLGRVDIQELTMKSGDRVSVRAWFAGVDGSGRLAAKENAYLP